MFLRKRIEDENKTIFPNVPIGLFNYANWYAYPNQLT